MRKTNAAFLSLLVPSLVQAAFVTPPSGAAGVVERQIQEEYDTTQIPPEKEYPLIEIDEPADQLRLPDRVHFALDNIEFEGNTVFSAESLEKIARPYFRDNCSMQDIRDICAQIKAKYVEAGYFLTRVYPPPQTVKKGLLRLGIIEGKLGEVTIVGPKYYQKGFVEGYFSHLLGQPINYNYFVKALLLLNENSDMHAGAVFKRGMKTGTCDVIIRVNDKRPAHLYLNGNDYGSRTSTRTRTGGRFDWGNLMMDGDTLSVTGVLGSPIRHLRFVEGRYNCLLSKRLGMRLDLSYLYSDFVDPVIPYLHLKGRSEVGSIKLEIPQFRTRRLNNDYYVAFDIKKIQNFALSQTTSLDELRIIRTGLKIDYSDGLKGRNIWDLCYSQGIPNFLGASGVVSSKPSRAGAGGRFSILNLDYKRIQQMPWDMFLFINGNGQFSANKLPLAQQIYIGGIDTVRGFPSAAGLGDYGYFCNVEWRVPPFGLSNFHVPFSKMQWKEFIQFIGFLDNGQTYLHGYPNTETHRVLMTSAGVGLRVKGPYNFSLSYDIGFPLTDQKRTSNAITYLKITWNPF